MQACLSGLAAPCRVEAPARADRLRSNYTKHVTFAHLILCMLSKASEELSGVCNVPERKLKLQR